MVFVMQPELTNTDLTVRLPGKEQGDLTGVASK